MQTEHDYISRKEINEFLDRVEAVADGHSDEIIKGVILGTVDAIRTLVGLAKEQDVVPVKHGRWEWNEENWWHRCSACGMTFDYDKTFELFDHGFQLANYCPYCGARMDGEDNG